MALSVIVRSWMNYERSMKLGRTAKERNRDSNCNRVPEDRSSGSGRQNGIEIRTFG